MVIQDPPFNVPVNGHVGGKGCIQHREFAMASGEMTRAEFTAFLTTALQLAARFSRKGSVHFIFMDFRHLHELLTAGEAVYDTLLNLCVWVKNNGGMGSLYRSRHELIFVFRNGSGPHTNNVELGRHGRYRTNVWEYPGINTLRRSSEEGDLLAMHPTVKPIRLIADAMLDCSDRGDIVLDAFLGSGSSLMSAQRTGRILYGIEIDPLYVDTAIRRWQADTGQDAIHAVSGQSFRQQEAAAEGGEHDAAYSGGYGCGRGRRRGQGVPGVSDGGAECRRGTECGLPRGLSQAARPYPLRPRALREPPGAPEGRAQYGERAGARAALEGGHYGKRPAPLHHQARGSGQAARQ